MYKVVLCGSNLPGDQELVEKTFKKMSEAIDYVQERWADCGFGLVFTIHDYPVLCEGTKEYINERVCTYVHMVDSEQINTMKDYKYMAKEPIYKEIVRIYDEFKDAMGIQEW